MIFLTFHFANQHRLVFPFRSYFGGLQSLGWSPDGKYIVTGGEDDLVTVFSVYEKRVVCRGQGHRSWISQVLLKVFETLTRLLAKKKKWP